MDVRDTSPKHLLIPELEMYLVESLPGFSCKRCARCCGGKLITLYPSDIDRIKPKIKDSFYQETSFLEQIVTGSKIKMRMKRGKCFFLEGNHCKIYDVRPNTCRRHPFLVTDKYLLVSSTCKGIDWAKEQSAEFYRVLSKDISKKIDSFIDGKDLKLS